MNTYIYMCVCVFVCVCLKHFLDGSVRHIIYQDNIVFLTSNISFDLACGPAGNSVNLVSSGSALRHLACASGPISDRASEKSSCSYEPVEKFSSVQSFDRLGRQGDMRDDSAEILFKSFLQEAHVSSSGMGRDVHSFNVVHPAHSPGCHRDGSGEAVVARDMPEPCVEK